MNRHALSVLEFPQALALVAEKAASALGRDAVLARRPVADLEELERELGRVRETGDFLASLPGWGPPAIPDARMALRRLALEGSVLEPPELHAVGVLITAGRVLGEALEEGGEQRPSLATLRELLVAHPELEERIAKTVDAEGSVLDTASPELRRIRGELARAHTRIVERLERYMRSLPARFQVSDASVTIREGRYVIPVRREGKGEVGGLVHDESGTGMTVFVEPPLAVDLMNRLRELERDEGREVRRILREVTGRLQPLADALSGSQAALVDFDALHARARAGAAWEGEVPELLPPGTDALRVVQGRHPLLLARGVRVVPFDLDLGPGERCLVVSGPNTGGKSVFLKALGLIVALTQSGCVPPVARGTKLPVFTELFADIGDEQSIAESLSTFSAHLVNLKEILQGADRSALVLIDEMGTGTDPAEGAALARAVLEELVARGAVTVATSHLGALKTLAREGAGVVNASLQFDPDRVEPTYQLVKGRPGRSYGLAIARRLGFPAEVLDRAEGHRSGGEASVEDLLERLERKEKEAGELVASLAREREEVARLRSEAEARDAQLREQERSWERRAREDARRLLMDARGEVDAAIREVREAAERGREVEEASRQARRRVEEAARRQRERRPAGASGAGDGLELRVGQRVRLASGGATGTVRELRDGRAVVETSGLRMELPVADLEPLDPSGGGAARARRARSRVAGAGAGVGGQASPEAPEARGGGWSGPEPEARTEIDLRGLRVEEVEMELGRALDGAVLAELAEVRIIHGKGTGALRTRVQELLQTDRRVSAFRLGLHGEGGSGVTVARLG